MMFDATALCAFVCAVGTNATFIPTAAVRIIKSNTTTATHLFMDVPSRGRCYPAEKSTRDRVPYQGESLVRVSKEYTRTSGPLGYPGSCEPGRIVECKNSRGAPHGQCYEGTSPSNCLNFAESRAKAIPRAIRFTQIRLWVKSVAMSRRSS